MGEINDTRRVRNLEEQNRDLWLRSLEGAPDERDIFNLEEYVAGPGSEWKEFMGGPIQDSGAREAQARALRQLQGIAEGGGYTGLERGQIAQAQRQAARHEQGQRAAIQQQMAMRGMSGSGASMAAQLSGRQQSANMAQDSANQIATAAQMRALQAMQGAGQLGSQQQSNELSRQGQLNSQAGQRAGAIDAFNQANTNRRQGTVTRNASGRTAATNQAWSNQQAGLEGLTGSNSETADRTEARNAAAIRARAEADQAAMNASMSAIGGI